MSWKVYCLIFEAVVTFKKQATFQQWVSPCPWGWPSRWRCPRRWGGSLTSSRTRTAGFPTSSWCSAAAPWMWAVTVLRSKIWLIQATLTATHYWIWEPDSVEFHSFNSLELPVVVEHLPSGALLCLLHPTAGLDNLDSLDNFTTFTTLTTWQSWQPWQPWQPHKMLEPRDDCSWCPQWRDYFT